jgi:beta-glucosidase-like glycosyl hydrolase
MVSHAAFPDISEFLQDLFRQEGDPPTIQGLHQFPATISGNVTTRLLRMILKFDGLVITDDMEMGAVVQTLTVPEACLRAVEAGSDMVLICEREENVVASRDELARAVREQRLSTRALAAAARRTSWALKLVGETESFDAEEFDAVSRRFGQLKLELKAAEDTGEYSPLFGTADGGSRRSSNF